MNKIDRFDGDFRFLSNFFPAQVELDGILFPTVEHAFQAAKTVLCSEREMVRDAPTPGKAKRLGKKVTLRPDWFQVRVSVMEDLLRKKFADPTLRSMLDLTRGFELIEGNSWGDKFWGVCDGEGENQLGKLLMKIREENDPS